MRSLCAPWVALHENLGLAGAVRDEAHYEQLLAVAQALMEDGSAEAEPMAGLVNLIADRIREYEDRVHPWPEQSSPQSVLAFLMEQHGLRQSDLPEIGSQGVVSEVLAGKRSLNWRQVQALTQRFAVPADVFRPTV